MEQISVYLTIGDSHLRELESLILRIIKPPGNKQKGKFARSENLRQRFKQDWYAEMRHQLSALLGGHAKRPPREKKDTETVGRRPVLSAFANRPKVMRAHFKGRTLWAYVRKSGLIWFKRKHFQSPSAAGIHAVNRKTCNGWTFWEYQRAPGDWVPLDNLRR